MNKYSKVVGKQFKSSKMQTFEETPETLHLLLLTMAHRLYHIAFEVCAKGDSSTCDEFDFRTFPKCKVSSSSSLLVNSISVELICLVVLFILIGELFFSV